MAQVEDNEYEDVVVVSHIKLEGIDYCTKRLKIVCQPFGWDGLAVPNPRKRLFPERDYHKIQDIGFLGARQDTFLITGKMHQSLCQFGALGRMNVQAIRHLDDENLIYNQLRLNFLNLSVFFYKSYTVLLQLRPKTFIWSGKELKESEPVNVCWKSSKFCYRAKVGQTVHCFRNAQTYNDRVYYITDEGELMELSFWDVVFHEKDPELIHKIKVKQSVLLAGGVDAFCISTDSREPALIIGTVNGSISLIPTRKVFEQGMNPRKLQKSKAWKTVKLIDTVHWSQGIPSIQAQCGVIVAAGTPATDGSHVSVWLFSRFLANLSQLTWKQGELVPNLQFGVIANQLPATNLLVNEDLVQDIEIFQLPAFRTPFILIVTHRASLLCTSIRGKLIYIVDLLKLRRFQEPRQAFTATFRSQFHSNYLRSHNSVYLMGERLLAKIKLTVSD